MNKTLYILCAALALSACNSFIEEDMAENIACAPTLSLKVNLPDFKPTFSDTDTRAITTDNAWETGDELLVVLNQSDASRTEIERLTLTYNGTTWDVPEDASMITSETVDFSEAITLTVSERLATATTTIFPEITIYHAPECKWEDGSLNLKETALTSTPEVWFVSASGLTWETYLARLCIMTGTEGDKVTLTSTGFSPHLNFKKDDGIYTATTDAEGKAYFYGTLSESTDGFEVILTDLEQGSLTYDDVTLMKASALVPVSLAQETSYIQDVTSLREDIAEEMNSIVTNGGYLVATDGTYEVYTYEGLMAWNEKAREANSTGMKLMRDITFPRGADGNYLTEPNGTAITLNNYKPSGSNWTTIGSLSGSIDGNGKTITGLRVYTTFDNTGLIGVMTGTIKNLTMSDAVVYSTASYTAVLAAQLTNGSIMNCTITDNCSVGNAGSSGMLGGFVGESSGTSLIECENKGRVDGYRNVGGIVGYGVEVTLQGCTNTGEVIGSAYRIGGIAGQCFSSKSVVACCNTGIISGSSNVGGIIGYADGKSGTLNVIGCWTCDTSEKIDTTDVTTGKDGIGTATDDATVTDCYSGDAATINGKVTDMNTALNGHGYSWTAGTDGGWPTLTK